MLLFLNILRYMEQKINWSMTTIAVTDNTKREIIMKCLSLFLFILKYVDVINRLIELP